MTEDNKTPAIRFKGFTDAWEQHRLGDVVEICRGGSPRPIQNYLTINEDGVNWIKIGDTSDGSRYITHCAEKIKPEGLPYTREVHIGDLILSNSMSFGKPYILSINGCIHDGWLLIRNKKDVFDLEFLQEVLSSDQMLKQYKALAAGGVVNNLNSALVQSTEIAFPSKIEQKKLGQFFKSLDTLITLHQRKLDKLKEVKKSLLQKMFPADGEDTPKIRFKGYTDAWEQRRLGDVLTESKKIKADVTSQNDLITLKLNLGGVVLGGNRPSLSLGSTIYYVRHAGQLIYGKQNFFHGSIGIIPKEFDGKATSGDVPTFDFRNADASFIFYYLARPWYYESTETFATGTGSKRIHEDIFLSFKINIPSIEEQTKIASIFKRLDTLITLHQRKLEKLQQIKKALLQKMFI